jgi:diketogulonate reductase-like aldo/keto reductase
VLSALKAGYTYLDTAQMYRNAGSVGAALQRWDGKREDVYIVTKCTVPLCARLIEQVGKTG